VCVHISWPFVLYSHHPPNWLSFLTCRGNIRVYFFPINMYLWRHTGRWLSIRHELNFSSLCILFILLFNAYSILTLDEPADFITAECGLLCGSFSSNGCSLNREGIYGCHAVSAICQKQAHKQTNTQRLFTTVQPLFLQLT